MNKNKRIRNIIRWAILQEYEGTPLTLMPLISEVKKKGYQGVMFFIDQSLMAGFRKLAARANAEGLLIGVLTGYMNYENYHLSTHPEQRFVAVSSENDQDGLPMDNRGCPYHPDFKRRYLDFLGELAAVPGVGQIMVNDEASMANGCYCQVCRQSYRELFGGEMPSLLAGQKKEQWEDARWRDFLRWRIERWNKVHGEMRAAVKEINRDIRVIFQTSPSVDLCWDNPWMGAVDLSSMVEDLDGLSVDPYHTFHVVSHRPYNPPEIYLSDWCRFLRGLQGKDKTSVIVPQGFTHSTFTRPLDERDGYWTAVIPAACGIDHIAPYTYPLMKCSLPVLEAYEHSFAIDRPMENVVPLDWVGLVHGVRTEIYCEPLPRLTPLSYDGTRVLPCAESLRQKGLPYGYIPDRRITMEVLQQYKAVILPDIECLNDRDAENLLHYRDKGGHLIITGRLGGSDGTGRRRACSLLEEMFHLKVERMTAEKRGLKFTRKHPLEKSLLAFEKEKARRYMCGKYHPWFGFSACADVAMPGKGRVLAGFLDDQGNLMGKPAIIELSASAGGGRAMYFAGIPPRVIANPHYHTTVRNVGQHLLPAAVDYLVGEKPPLRVETWPPMVPIALARPFDYRQGSTFEFFPLTGKDTAIGVVVSYFKEPAKFRMTVKIPPTRRLAEVRELITGQKLKYRLENNLATVAITMKENDAIVVICFTFN